MPVRKQLPDRVGNPLIVQEGEGCNVNVTFEGFLSSAPTTLVTLTKDQITSVKCWLFEDVNNVKINSRKDQEVKDDNDGTMTTDGTLTIAFDADDNPVVNSLSEEGLETHVLRLQFFWNDGVKLRSGISEHFFQVEKLAVVADS